MSKLIDKLNKVTQFSSQLMGFRAGQPPISAPKMVLIASINQANFGGMDGADAGLLTASGSGLGAEYLTEAVRAVPDIPWGGRLRDATQEGITTMVKAGSDYIVFPVTDAILLALQEETVGRILEIDMSVSEGLFRTVDKLPVDALLIGGEPQEIQLTWHRLMHLQRGAGLLDKPLLTSVPLNVTAAELRAIREAGVNGIIVEVGQQAGSLAELRRAVDSLPPPSKNKGRKPAALLPHIAQGVDRTAEEEEE